MLPRIVIAVALIAHGFGCSMRMFGVSRIVKVNPTWQCASWIPTRLAGQPPAHLGVSLWVIAVIGVALGAMALGWPPETCWRPLAIVSSIASFAGLVLFPIAFPVCSSIGALAVDAAVVIAMLWYGWGPGSLAS